jgi:glycosyltransferase involved in cell wall biosynthesis
LHEELPSSQARVLSFLEPRILRLYGNTSIFTSQSTKEDLLRLGIAERNLNVINYGVNHDVYRLGKTKSSYPHVLYLGRLKRFKGVHLLIEAMAQVVKEIPQAKLTIVGNGDPDYRNELKQLSAKLNLTKHIAFYEFGLGDSLAQKVKMMQEAWVLVFPSAREGFGLVIVEANACGTPTIATNVPGLRETVRDNDTGILVARNVDALANSMKRVLSNNELREKLSRKAFEWSMQFDWDRTAGKMLKVLEEIVT